MLTDKQRAVKLYMDEFRIVDARLNEQSDVAMDDGEPSSAEAYSSTRLGMLAYRLCDQLAVETRYMLRSAAANCWLSEIMPTGMAILISQREKVARAMRELDEEMELRRA